MRMKKMIVVSLIAGIMGFSIPYVNYAIDSTYEKIKVLIEAFEVIKNEYVDEKDSEELLYSAINGMVSALDDFSQFLRQKAYERVKSDTEGEFGGIGIRIDIKDGWPIVITPFPNTPAYKAKIYPGDRIIKIDGKSTENITSEEVVDKLRGKPGTKVKITIAREPENKDKDWQIMDIELVRDNIKIESIVSKMLNEDTGLIRILEFSGHMVEDFNDAISDLVKKGMKKLVLDLRYNPGGLLVASIDIAKLFLDSNKMIVYTKGRKEKDYAEYRSGETAKYANIPIVVLVNKYSASASEILAGALKDNKRAIVVGENTFGKASVQTIVPLSDKSALRLTIAKYYTPNGDMIQRDPQTGKGGITPDIEIKLTREEEILLYEQMQTIYYPDSKHKNETKKIEDKALNKALEVLKMMDIIKRTIDLDSKEDKKSSG